jgi:hypothetical protein
VSWKVTVRNGPEVARDKVGSLDQALALARERVEEVLAEDRLGKVEGFRTYGPGERVQARIEVSGPGLLRGPEAGIDVMGNGSLVPYAGAIRKRQLEAGGPDQAIESIRRVLAASEGGGA